MALHRSRLAGTVVLAAGLAVSAAGSGGAARAESAALAFPTRSAAVSWGKEACGLLGNGVADPSGGPVNQSLPGSVLGLASGVVAVSAGDEFAMALTSDGRVWTWGDNNDNDLGTGDVPNECSAVPAPVPGLTDVVQVEAGDWAGYALRSDGTVWAWGLDSAVGYGAAPTQVPGLTGVTQIAASVSGFALALRSDGTVWGWGDDQYGTLGPGAGPGGGTIRTPVQVKGISGAVAISAGQSTALAITHRQAGGAPTTLTTVWAWGLNTAGQLGDGTTSAQPQPVPQVVPGLPQVTSVSAGDHSSLAVGSDGSVWGWGMDHDGELGNAPQNADVLRPIETFAPGSKIIQVSAQLDHSLALRSDGTVLAFGQNNDGQLGTGTISKTSLPVQVSGLTGVSQVSAGFQYSLAVHQRPIVKLP